MRDVVVIDPEPILVIPIASPERRHAARFWARIEHVIECNYDDAWAAWFNTLPRAAWARDY